MLGWGRAPRAVWQFPSAEARRLTARRAWQTEAHPRYGVTRQEELGLEVDRGERCQGWDTVIKGKAAVQHG
jgi:hypothetical protein